ncbi:hypothetical protein [[Flexibacter] sp. ATCC 35208]|uniref:hypothetical protein n=1 Tax=[Flexibacter] sp. ATCC 35208 TaxID=1936242 RepID=UPI0009CC34D3|nr:hypothetical protein [[Flexibacter] sp. ATCC 35208]OMP79450.1 hypothetical protein BW716_10180 [[Flexibacter] sp. ATCC 35208]
MKFILSPLILLLLVAGCKKDTPGSPGENNPDSVSIITQALYYQTNLAAAPDTISVNYNADHRIEKINQAYHSSPGIGTWTFTYNANGTIANVKGGRLYWESKQDYYLYYNNSKRLDSLLINDVSFDGDSVRLKNVYTYDANSHIKSSYTIVSNGGTSTGFYTGDTIAKAVFSFSNDIDSVNYNLYSYQHINTDPPVTNVFTSADAVHFNKTVVDISTLDNSLLFWLSIKSNVYAPLNLFNPFWYQYINPDILMARGGTINTETYDFSTTKSVNGDIAVVSFVDARGAYSRLIKLAYTRIPY